MDPEATYRELLEAIAQGDREAAVHHAGNLAGWLRRGGFAPVVDQRLAGFPRLQTVLAKALCRAVLEPTSSNSLFTRSQP
jgi:hypothetical protein